MLISFEWPASMVLGRKSNNNNNNAVFGDACLLVGEVGCKGQRVVFGVRSLLFYAVFVVRFVWCKLSSQFLFKQLVHTLSVFM